LLPALHRPPKSAGEGEALASKAVSGRSWSAICCFAPAGVPETIIHLRPGAEEAPGRKRQTRIAKAVPSYTSSPLCAALPPHIAQPSSAESPVATQYRLPRLVPA